jgi:hypothetical protein
VNKKVKKKMILSRETLLNLENARLQEAAGGVTVACSLALSCWDSCPVNCG